MAKKTILWADDDTDDLQMMREIMQKHRENYQIVEAPNGSAVLEYLRSHEQDLPSLIILDINMPVMDGKQTLSTIKKNDLYREIPIVVFTTSDSKIDRLFCQRYATEMITKPPNFKTLESTVMELIAYTA